MAFSSLKQCLRLTVALIGLTVFSSATTAAVPTPPPNIVFILADDLGYGDIGAYGQIKFRTPNIDRIAAGGMKFTQHYACLLYTSPSPRDRG